MLLAPALLAQAPVKPAILSIKSVPPEAAIVVNGETWRQKTNATVVVPPGTYRVSVTSDQLKKCPPKAVNVGAGTRAEITCTETGWQ
jgi:hypothetical protein